MHHLLPTGDYVKCNREETLAPSPVRPPVTTIVSLSQSCTGPQSHTEALGQKLGVCGAKSLRMSTDDPDVKAVVFPR